MDDITASIVVACQTSQATASVNQLSYAFTMLSKKLLEFGVDAVGEFRAAQDASWKFSRVFKNIMGTATKAAEDFAETYNLSEQTAKSMLGDTASILKGAGMGERAALKMSESVARMGVDLASYTGYAGGAKGATEAITAAMLGETERMKALGTVIRMDSKEFTDLTQSIMKNKRVSEQQARMMATLELIYRKGADAIGDYVSEGENFTQSVNNWSENVKEFKANFGQVIYEVLGLNNAVGGLNQKLQEINEWWKKEGSAWTYAIRSVFIDISSGVELMGAGLKAGLQTFQAFFTSLTKMFTSFSINWKADWMSMAQIAAKALNNPVGALKDLTVMAWKSVDFKGINFGADFNRILDENKKAQEAALKRYKEGLMRPQDKNTGGDENTAEAMVSGVVEAQKRSLAEFSNILNQYRATTQNAIYSDSIEAMRLSSRRLVGGGVNPAEATAKNTEKQVKLNEDIAKSLADVVNKINTMLNGGIKLSNLSVKTY
jgi:hypothetical protein